MNRSTIAVAVVILSIPFISGYGCNPCGNGKLDPGEQCDDGNNAGADGCSATCQTETATNCVPSTAAAMQAAMVPFAGEFDPLKTKAQQLGFDTTTYMDVLECNEGGATTQWVGLLPTTARRPKPGAVLVLRPDAPPSLETTLYYTASSGDAYMITPYLIWRTTSGGTTTVTDINGNALPKSTAAADVPSWQKEAIDHFFRSSR